MDEKKRNTDELQQMTREIGEIGAGIRPAAQPVVRRDGAFSHVRMEVVVPSSSSEPRAAQGAG